MIRVGIIGAGHMGNTHGAVLQEAKGARVVGVADPDLRRAGELADFLGAQAFQDFHRLLEQQLDAVWVTTPNTLHAEAVLDALAAGAHVFSEKPMATNLPEAKRIARAVAAAGRIYQLGFNRRFAPVYVRLFELIAEKQIHPHSLHLKMNRGELMHPSGVGNPQVTGGFLYESAIHLLDLVRWLFGDVASLLALGKKGVYSEVDDFSVLLKFKSGVQAAFTSCAHTSWIFPFERIEVFGEHAAAETAEMDEIRFTTGLKQKVVMEEYRTLPNPEKWGYVQEDAAFLAAISRKSRPLVTARDGLAATQLVEAIYRSVKRGKWIKPSAL
jgi:myo-inositol 2-dehydrogenase / D-chiro-inositol 1-dehydrogenase